MGALFDAHCDTAFAIYEGGEPLRKNACHTDLERGAACFPRGQVYAVWQHGDGLAVKAREVLGGLLREIELNSDLVALCRSYGDIKAAFSAGKQAAIISVEGAELISCSEAELERVHGLGVRIINLCWNSDNALCGSAVSGGGGLTEKGRGFVRLCGELGVVVYGEGEGTLKKFIRRGNAVILQPFNTAYVPQVIMGEDLEQLHVVGKVVETRARW